MKNALSVSLLVVCSLLAGCNEQEVVAESSPRPVRSLLIDTNGVGAQKTYAGVSRSAQESRLSFKVSGTVNSIPVRVGDEIKAGSVIASLDPSTYELQLQQSQATVAQSSAASRNARAGYDRTRALYANNNTSLGELDSSRANSESASAQLRAARKSLQLAQLNVAYTKLTVDVDCVVDSIAVELNENVSTNTEIARVNCSEEIEVEVAVPEGIISEISNGKKATIRFDAIDGQSFAGTVTEVGVGASGVGSTFPITVLITEKNSKLRSGLAASVAFDSARAVEGLFVVPLSAIVKRSNGAFVYVVNSVNKQASKGTGEVALREVQLGELRSAGIEVISGLAVGDRIVTAGVSFMRDNLQVVY